jgi:hypothetical protein
LFGSFPARRRRHATVNYLRHSGLLRSLSHDSVSPLLQPNVIHGKDCFYFIPSHKVAYGRSSSHARARNKNAHDLLLSLGRIQREAMVQTHQKVV